MIRVKGNAVEMCLLFDFYGEMLTPKQREIFDLYYNEDLSLAEIAEHEAITRQGVRDAIVRSESALRDMEAKMQLVARFRKFQDIIDHIDRTTREIVESSDYRRMSSEGAERIDRLRALAGELAE